MFNFLNPDFYYNYYCIIEHKKDPIAFDVRTEKFWAVDRSTFQFWTLSAKGHST